MWILVAILKWIGILLGAVLGLCLLLAVLVIFVPVRYRICGSSKKEIAYSFKFSWLLSILSVKKKKHSDRICLYLFGIPIRCLAGGDKEKKKAAKKNQTDQRPAHKNQETGDQEGKAECRQEEKKSSQKSVQTPEPDQKQRKGKRRWKVRKGKKKKKKKAFSFRKVSSIISFVKQNWDVVKRLFGELKELIRYLSPTKVRGEAVIGTGDPASTGLVFGGLSLFPVFYQEGVQITPDFEEKRFEAEGIMKGRLRLIYFLRLLFRLYKDSELKRLWKHVNQVKKEAA